MQLRDDGDIDASPLGLNRSAHAREACTQHNYVVSNHQEPPKAVHGDAARVGRVRAVADARKDVTGVTMGKFAAIARHFAAKRGAAESHG